MISRMLEISSLRLLACRAVTSSPSQVRIFLRLSRSSACNSSHAQRSRQPEMISEILSMALQRDTALQVRLAHA
jgi:hypothetical protein